MRNRNLILIAGGVCVLSVTLFFALRSGEPPPGMPASRERTVQATPNRPFNPTPAPDPQPPVAAPSAPSIAPLAVNTGMQPTLEEPPITAGPERQQSIWPPAESRVESVRTTIRQYGSAFNGNPVGTNTEITAALNGDNPKHTFFLNGGDGNTINAKGELSDAWGSPYFFHQLSAQEMEVRSAGPDRIMYTPDDLIAR